MCLAWIALEFVKELSEEAQLRAEANKSKGKKKRK